MQGFVVLSPEPRFRTETLIKAIAIKEHVKSRTTGVQKTKVNKFGKEWLVK